MPLRIAGFAVFGLALVVTACGGGGDASPPATEQPTEVTISDTGDDQPFERHVIDFVEKLREDNAEAYTIGCMSVDDFTSRGWNMEKLVAWLPSALAHGPSSDGKWAVGTVGSVGFNEHSAFIVTLYDPDGVAIVGATDFERLDEQGRSCFSPQEGSP